MKCEFQAVGCVRVPRFEVVHTVSGGERRQLLCSACVAKFQDNGPWVKNVVEIKPIGDAARVAASNAEVMMVLRGIEEAIERVDKRVIGLETRIAKVRKEIIRMQGGAVIEEGEE